METFQMATFTECDVILECVHRSGGRRDRGEQRDPDEAANVELVSATVQINGMPLKRIERDELREWFTDEELSDFRLDATLRCEADSEHEEER